MRIFDFSSMQASGLNHAFLPEDYAATPERGSPWWDAFAPTHRLLVVAMVVSVFALGAAWALAV